MTRKGNQLSLWHAGKRREMEKHVSATPTMFYCWRIRKNMTREVHQFHSLYKNPQYALLLRATERRNTSVSMRGRERRGK